MNKNQCNTLIMKNIFTLMFLYLWVAPLQAAFILDAYASGVDVVRDTETGIEWLDLRETAGLSVNDILNGVGNTWLQDFQYATREQFDVLVQHIFGSDYQYTSPLNPERDPARLDYIDSAMQMLGVTSSSNNGSSWSRKNIGFLDPSSDDPARVDIAQISIGASTFNPRSAYYFVSIDDIDNNHRNSIIGSYLVRTASVVPLPAAAWLFGSGLLGLFGWLERNQLNQACI